MKIIPPCSEGDIASEDVDNTEWKDFSSYKKAEYLMRNKPDCSFVVGRSDFDSKVFYCHKWILESASPVFQTMFNGNFKESNASKEINVTDTDPSTFKKFLDFIYYGNIENFQYMDILTVRNLIYLGKKYMIAALTDSCIENMKKSLENVENCDLICIFEYAYLMEDNDLIEKCKKVIVGRKPKSDFKIPLDYNINKHEEKRHIAQARRAIGSFPNNASPSFQVQPQSSTFGGNSNNTNLTHTALGAQKPALSFSDSTPFAQPNPPEEKIENIVNFNALRPKEGINIFSETVFGVNKGDITTCSYIHELTPPIFYEFQKTLSGYVSEVARFNMIEMYAKINGYVGETIEHSEKLPENNNNNNNNNDTIKNVDNNEGAEANGSFDNISENTKNQAPNTMPLQKEMLNMMLCSINFLRMGAKEFCRGPGKSNLLDTEEKYNLLVGIINKN